MFCHFFHLVSLSPTLAYPTCVLLHRLFIQIIWLRSNKCQQGRKGIECGLFSWGSLGQDPLKINLLQSKKVVFLTVSDSHIQCFSQWFSQPVFFALSDFHVQLFSHSVIPRLSVSHTQWLSHSVILQLGELSAVAWTLFSIGFLCHLPLAGGINIPMSLMPELGLHWHIYLYKFWTMITIL